ncbi:HAD family hydrolase [Bifidobacterium castoris]|uniref:Alpha/beta hydrolase n=1 Tax=Bifidobacterium castoris TaxID=2306972 RepID=A0A430F886_9BIFI|nr:HAD family phosphatase [Bifidobacterium castoris]RSX49066.1 alpha/beta hydrolase [Bifidobacterium castoris]
MPITDVVFDYCGVLLDWRPELTMEGLVPTPVIRRVLDRADPYGFWHYDLMSDLGWSPEQVLADFRRHHPHDDDLNEAMRLYFANYRRAFAGMIAGMPALLHELDGRGCRLWGLTNFSTPFVTLAHAEFPAMHLLRGTIVSSQERCAKPDPKIYTIAIGRFGLRPGQTMFFDDKFENARAATEVGMRGVRFIDADQALQAVRDAD